MIDESKYLELVSRQRNAHEYFKKMQRKIVNEPESEEKFAKLELMELVLNRTSEIVNWWNNLEAKERNRERHLEELERARQKKERKERFDRMYQEQNTLPQKNTACRYYCESSDGEMYCSISMDTTFCSKRCAYATNVKGSTKVYK